MRHDYLPAIEKLLREAGWGEGRRVDLGSWLEVDPDIFPAAREVLEAFGGLRIGHTGAGIEVAASDIDLRFLPPTELSIGYETEEEQLGQRVYFLGMIHNGHAEMLIDESGAIYDLADDFIRVAPTFAEALVPILLGTEYESDVDLHASDEDATA